MAPDPKNRYVHDGHRRADSRRSEAGATNRIRHPGDQDIAGLEERASEGSSLIGAKPPLRPVTELADADVSKLRQPNRS
jgi:hypothetical protein